MVTQTTLALDSDSGTMASRPQTGSADGYELIREEIGDACLALMNDIVDQAGVTKSLPEFTAHPFGMALEAAISKRYEELKVQWPGLQEEEILAKAKSLAGRIASHRRNYQKAPRKMPSPFRAPWLHRGKRR